MEGDKTCEDFAKCCQIESVGKVPLATHGIVSMKKFKTQGMFSQYSRLFRLRGLQPSSSQSIAKVLQWYFKLKSKTKINAS